jgi:hypothetical protein
MSAFGVADRCLDTELFPTQLRATYAGASRLAQAFAAIVTQFGLSALSAQLGGLVPAISWLSVVTFLPALGVFLLTVPETRGLTLERASGDVDGTGGS